MIYLFLADGFEEMEALAPVDILRRAGLEVKTVGVTGKTVTSSRKIPVVADITTDEICYDDMDMVILPGGLPGTVNLENSKTVSDAVLYCNDNDKYIAAICAAPRVLGKLGVLNGKNATCFPGNEEALINGGANHLTDSVVVDGKAITGKGAGVAVKFSLAIVEALCGKEASDKLFHGMQCE